jgi:hypothetical protein
MKAEVGDSVLVRGEVTHIEGATAVRVFFPGSEYPTVVRLSSIEQVTKPKKERVRPSKKVIYDEPD